MLSAALCISMLAGCGKDTGTEANSGGNGGTEADSGQSIAADDSMEAAGLPEDDPSVNVVFDTWMYADEYKHYTSYEENPVVEYLNNKFNVTMEYQLPAMGSEAENLNLMLGTGDYTDIMNTTYSSESLQSLYENGVIIDIAPYLEKYMPNYYALLQSSDELRKMVYDDEGHAFGLYTIEDMERNQWGGLVYRRDILETMTGGNIAFPSGNEHPVTVEDWDYMLPLMKTYFDAAGMMGSACIIVPACGYIVTGELVGGFGAGGSFQMGKDGKTVEYGPATEEFFNYVSKMKEWYEAGYVYQDFASRTNDLFYLPNTSLTYGGAAGIWFGLLEQNGTIMSMPEYNLNMEVCAITAPLDQEHGITEEDAGFYIFNGVATDPFCITSTCDESKLARIFTVMDYLYSEEGAKLRSIGLTEEQAADSTLYQEAGLSEGYYYYNENGEFCLNEKIINADANGLKQFSFQGGRLPGASYAAGRAANTERTENDEYQDIAGEVWVTYGRSCVYPGGATMDGEESNSYNSSITSITDYVNTMIPKFIMGTEELSEETWQKFVDQLYALGLDKPLAAKQSAFERYLAR